MEKVPNLTWANEGVLSLFFSAVADCSSVAFVGKTGRETVSDKGELEVSVRRK